MARKQVSIYFHGPKQSDLLALELLSFLPGFNKKRAAQVSSFFIINYKLSTQTIKEMKNQALQNL